MNRWKTAALGAATVALILSGCSDAGDPADAAPAETAATTPAESPSPTQAGATVEQWASLVAQQRHAYDDTEQSWEDATCSPTTAARGAADCQALMLTMSNFGDETSVAFADATDPGSATYLGEPPTEIAALVEETAAATEEVSSNWIDEECLASGIECADRTMSLHMAWEALGGVYAAWDPYM